MPMILSMTCSPKVESEEDVVVGVAGVG
jgi:hypothetical protein